jgi:hypothetical protein
MLQKFLNWCNSRPVKIIFENLNFDRLIKKERDFILSLIIKTYNKIHFVDCESEFVVGQDFSNLDNVCLIIYYRLPGVINTDNLSKFKDEIMLKTPVENMYYEGKLHKIYKISKKPVMMMVLLEYEMENKITREIVVPKLFNAGKI